MRIRRPGKLAEAHGIAQIVQKRVASTVSDQSAPVVYNLTVDFPDELSESHKVATGIQS